MQARVTMQASGGPDVSDHGPGHNSTVYQGWPESATSFRAKTERLCTNHYLSAFSMYATR